VADSASAAVTYVEVVLRN